MRCYCPSPGLLHCYSILTRRSKMPVNKMRLDINSLTGIDVGSESDEEFNAQPRMSFLGGPDGPSDLGDGDLLPVIKREFKSLPEFSKVIAGALICDRPERESEYDNFPIKNDSNVQNLKVEEPEEMDVVIEEEQIVRRIEQGKPA